MTTLQSKTALVIGASSGVGRATVKALVAEGAAVIAVARGGDALATLAGESDRPIQTVQADAADAATAERLLREFQPQLVVLAAGVHPHMAPIDRQTWETFSQAWHGDTQEAFHLVKAALTLPLAPGSTVAILSSGAAVAGSPLSGGYAGAKRMQWLMAEYAQEVSEAKQLGIRFLAVLPRQLIEGTQIGNTAAAGYGRQNGLSAAEFLKRRWNVPLTADKVAAAVAGALRGEVADGVAAIAVTGERIEPLD
ncbi:MAG TPA: SDR family oxidoreductase [Candidatus Baltobacteraceae bacterium]|jgi:NAD(P)-dependent dehydrogenase (short-subunit alcohol dehydrogenase family)|nr:SDR family oxidoreductase [Candidatus Baltobacteraceae bacterium]